MAHVWIPIGYFVLINLISFLAMVLDKYYAKNGKWRIRERTLFLFAFLMGAFGIYAGMRVAHHKTKHLKFRIGIPLVLLENLLILVFWYLYTFTDVLSPYLTLIPAA